VIFNDLLGSAREINNGPAKACFFIPANAEEHQTHALAGIPDAETSQHQQQWQPVDQYVNGTLNQLAQQKSSQTSTPKKVLFVFDVDHPDLAGRLPPQANAFIELLVQQWDELSQQLAVDFPTFDVYIWLSHDSGQKSYLDSDPEFVESIFKHRFERGVAGDVFLEIPQQERGRDINYSDLKKYIGHRVARDAATHNLVQAPVFLEPKSHSDFELLRFRQAKQTGVAKLGYFFGYSKREANAQQLDNLWEKFEHVKRRFDWPIENPHAIQQTNTILVQLERLWYEGKSESALFGRLEQLVNNLLNPHTSIQPVQHSLQDALALSQHEGKTIDVPEFPTEWLTEFDDLSSVPQEERKEASDAVDKKHKQLKKWKEANTDWPTALAIWKRLLAEKSELNIDREMIGRGLELLPRGSAVANRDEPTNSGLEFNEIVFLRRIHDELVWPDKSLNDHVPFEGLVRKAMESRDKSNRFIATLTPILSDQFRNRFEKIERQRRYLEDRLFAHDQLDGLGGLRGDFDKLINEFEELANDKKLFADRFQSIDQYWANIDSLSPNRMEEFSANQQPDLTPVNLGLFETTSDGRSASPARDIGGFRGDLGVVDGNLLGRRLLFWPELDLNTRKELHIGLAKNKVTLVESDNDDNENRQSFVNSGSLSPAMLSRIRATPQLTAATESPIKMPDDEEINLLRVAKEANRLNSFDGGQQSRLLSKFANIFHARKSDMAFKRVSLDLWGTAISQKPFVSDAIESHSQLVKTRLQRLRDRNATNELLKLREEISKIWESESKSWPQRMTEVRDFCESFDKWKWSRNEQSSFSAKLQGPYDVENDRENEMLFTVRSGKPEFGKVGQSQAQRFDDRIRLSTSESARFGEKLAIYLRGHLQIIATQDRQKQESRIVTVSLADEGIKGTRLRIERATSDPVIGEISILIDCSKSMRSRMDSARKYVNEFLKSGSKRADVKVSLYAVGASVWHNNDGQRTTNPDSLSSWSRINQQDDVWRYANSGSRLDKTTLRGFSRAVGQLKHFGETPLVAGLDLALGDNAGQPRLLVLLTDGFEFSKRLGESKAEAFDNARYSKVKSRLNNSATKLIIFNMLPVDVDPNRTLASADAQKLNRQFSNRDGRLPLPLDEIISRIEKINALTDANYRSAGDGKKLNLLGRFLGGVLPQPFVDRAPPFPNNIKPNESNSQLLRDIQLGPDDRPSNWHLGLEFRTSSSIDIFNKENVKWKTARPSHGNESLRFEYNPVRGTFDLVTEWKKKADEDKSLQVAGQQLWINGNLIGGDKPFFLVASKQPKELTPAPAITWLELVDPHRQRLLVQDFALGEQSLSNVHPVEFPEIESILGNKTLVTQGNSLDLNLAWMDSFPADLWTKLDVGSIDNSSIVKNENGMSQKIKSERYVSIEKLLSSHRKPFGDFDFAVRYENLSTEDFSVKIRVQRPKGYKETGKSLDRWLVQLLNSDGTERHRHCRQKSNRSYQLENDGNGNERLVAVIHEFVVSREQLQEHGASIGLANLDDIARKYKNLPTVSFPKFLEST